jgi:hypothetical protein
MAVIRVTISVQFMVRPGLISSLCRMALGPIHTFYSVVAGTLSPGIKTDETCGKEIQGLSYLVL